MKAVIKLGILALIGYAIYSFYNQSAHKQDEHETILKANPLTFASDDDSKLGDIVYTHNNVPIYSNGDAVYQSHGKHFSKDGYYYGRKWQCVEFIKRYFYDYCGHSMPNVWGHAKDFFDPGHVAIVSEVHSNYIIVAQQNIKGRPLAQIPLSLTSDKNYFLGSPSNSNNPVGWLRIP